MKYPRKEFMAAACFLLIAGLARPGFAQSTRIDSGSVSQASYGFYWETHLSPPTPPLANTFTTKTTEEPGVIHRVLLDHAGRVYVGYDVRIAVLPEPNTYRVTFQRLTMTQQMARQIMGDDLANWKQLPQSDWGPPAPQDIRAGEVLQLGLLANPATRQQVVDYVTVQEPARKVRGFGDPLPDRTFSHTPGPSRDFRTDDVELTLRAPRLIINRRLDETSTRNFGEVSGGIVWIYTAKRGRYVLSLVPRPELGFRRAGEIRGSALSFVVGNDEFRLSSGAQIAPGQAPFNLYVLHEPDWKPTYPNADLSVFIMGTERPETFVRK